MMGRHIHRKPHNMKLENRQKPITDICNLEYLLNIDTKNKLR